MKTRFLSLCGFSALAAVLLAGCAMTPAAGTSVDRNRLSGDELAATNSQMVYEAVELLRPEWLRGRGPVSLTDASEARPNVYVNGSRMGDLDYLREVYVTDVAELRYWTPGEAGARFGMGNPRGVIEIVRR